MGTATLRRRPAPPGPHDTRAASSDPGALVARIVADAAGEPAPAIPGYRLIGLLGAGGFGAVYLARRRRSGRLAALKVLLPEVAGQPGTGERFRREIQAQARLRHPNLVALDHHGEAAGVRWFSMEYCDGGNLATHARARGGRLGLGEAAALMLDALAGLAAVHALGYVHRDVKPHNLLLASRPGGGLVAKLGDFGLAALVAGTARPEGRPDRPAGAGPELEAGSWPYMPREQLLDFSGLRPSADVWSIAATFYEVLTGTPPRPAGPGHDPAATVLRAPATPILTRRPDLPVRVAEVFDRSLEVDPVRRYPNAGGLRAALLAALGDRP